MRRRRRSIARYDGSMLADALATAALSSGLKMAFALLENHGVDGLIVTAGLQAHKTRGLLHVA
jgi:hypothetical protein